MAEEYTTFEFSFNKEIGAITFRFDEKEYRISREMLFSIKNKLFDIIDQKNRWDESKDSYKNRMDRNFPEKRSLRPEKRR